MRHENKIRLKVIGRTELLPGPIRVALDQAIRDTESYSGGTLILALSYGARPELVDAARAMAQKVKTGDLAVDAIDETSLSEHLYTAGIPDPDLMIRTSGEQRISNFLLWQLSYSELYFTDVYWPDFREEQFYEALREYARRKRRFGDITEKDEEKS